MPPIDMSHYQVIIVGAGATGGWAARRLCEKGVKTLLVEAGEDLTRKRPAASPTSKLGRLLRSAIARFGSTFMRRSPAGRRPIQSRCCAYSEHSKHVFVDDLDNPYSVPPAKPFTWIRMRVVGGRSAAWSRVAVRMSDHQLRPRSLHGYSYDWPLSYSDLKPYYDQVENCFGVCGDSANNAQVPDGCFLPGRSMRPYELDFKQQIESKWTDRKVLLAPHVRLGPPLQPESSNAGLFHCVGSSSVAHARLSGNLTLCPASVVERISVDPSGRRATGVEFIDTRSRQKLHATGEVVLLCASTLETTRIMLNSKGPHHPRGLGNSSGVLGHYLIDHTCGVSVLGRKPGQPDEFPDVSAGLYIPPAILPREEPTPGSCYQIQGAIGFRLSENGAEHGCALNAMGEVLPSFNNWVELSPRLVDAWGIPALHIDYSYSPREHELAQCQASELSAMLQVAGYELLSLNRRLAPPGASIHECGTARMGRDPNDSVLNSSNQCWEIPNLFITDGSCFVTSGFQNPTLTMLAITARACDLIADRLRFGGF